MMKTAIKLLTYLILLCLLACAGGGTKGTGLGIARIIMGTLTSEDQALSGATVTIIETGESDITDEQGMFSIETETQSTTVNLQIQKDEIDTTVQVTDLDDDSNNLNLEISLETKDNLSSVKSLEVWARIVGTCDAYFENKPRIRQSVAVSAGGVDCTLKFFASGDGKRLERVPAVLEVRSCDEKDWRRIAVSMTGVGAAAGVGQLEFKYLDNQENCLYRLRAPIDIPDTTPVKVFIDSFNFQEL